MSTQLNQQTDGNALSKLEREVESRSAGLKKELGLFDLVLIQIVFVVGTVWVGWAAKLGDSQIIFWVIAIVLFYLPARMAMYSKPDKAPTASLLHTLRL